MNNIKPYTYLLKFKPTGQLYYGSRIKNVKLGLTPKEDFMKKYATSSKKINQLVEEFGVDAFEWKIRTHNTEQQATAWETRFLKRCKVLEHPDVWFNRNIAGHILATEESNKKISEYHTGKPKSEDHKQKMRESRLNYLKDNPVIVSKETKQKISNAMSGENNPRYGVEVSNETRAKISAGNKGKTRSEAVKLGTSKRMLSLGENHPGKNKSEETRKKLSLALSGKKRKPHTEETKQKISDALKGKAKGLMSESEKLKRSATLKGKMKSAESSVKKSETLKELAGLGQHHSQIIKICPHCGKSAKTMSYARWHGDRCSAVKKLTRT